MPNSPELSDFRPANDHDMLVMLLANSRHIMNRLGEIQTIQTDTSKELGALHILADRHDSRINAVEQSQAERKAQVNTVVADVSKLKDDVMGRIARLESERLDPIDDKINSVKNWIAGAVAVLVFLWIFLAPLYVRLIERWFGSP